jgi:hypothetical protein
MMAHPSRAIAARMIQELTLDAVIFSGRCDSQDLPILTVLDENADAPIALAAWAYDRIGSSVLSKEGAFGTRWASKLDMSNHDREQFAGTLIIAGQLLTVWDGLSIAHRKRLACRPHCCGAIMLARAIHPDLTQAICNDIQTMTGDGIGLSPEPLITGQTLIEMGHSPGQGFKEVLDRVYNAQLEGKVDSVEFARNLASELFVKLS